MSTIALILAGGSISHRLSTELSHIACPALMPLHLSTIGGLNVQFFNQNSDVVYLAVDAEYADEVTSSLGVDTSRYHLIQVKRASGVVDTLEMALDSIRSAYSDNPRIKVNLVTTIPTKDLSAHEIFVAKTSGRLVQQCSWLEDNNGVWLAHSKHDGADRDEVDAFTGSFSASLEELTEATALVTERRDLLGVVENLLKTDGRKFRVTQVEWIDCGHEISYLKARSKYLSSRSFNRLAIDLETGVISKRSEHAEKMDDEVAYLESLPNELKIHFPRLIQTLGDHEGRTEGYVLEYYSYPTLSEYALYWKISEDAWWMAFEQLDHIIRHFRKFRTSYSREIFTQAMAGKTRDRLRQYFDCLGKTERDLLWNKELTINGKLCPAFSQLQDLFFERLNDLYDEECFTVVHGDLCYNNILYSPAGGLIKLIDPRGSFGPHKGIHGDYRYDLAKLMHSVTGGYDAIVNGHYQLSHLSNTFDLQIQARQSSHPAEQAFRWLLRQQGADPWECQLLTASLFLSMIPLHSDCHLRQRAFFLNGLKLLNELES